MKTIFLRIGMLILTLAFGVTSVQLCGYFTNRTFEDSQLKITHEVNLIENTRLWEKGLIRIFLKNGELTYDNKNYVDVEVESFDRFIPYGYGCFYQSYLTDDGYFLSEVKFDRYSRKELDEEIKQSQKVIEMIKDAKNRKGEKGLRVVMQSFNKEDERTYFEIFWYRAGEIRRISAPTLELALEFEKWQKS